MKDNLHKKRLEYERRIAKPSCLYCKYFDKIMGIDKYCITRREWITFPRLKAKDCPCYEPIKGGENE